MLSYSLECDRLVEQLHSANSELAKLALTDSLTGLSNRRAILDNLARLLALAEREEKCVLVAVVDLDGFKQINDTFGHAAGDKLLCCVADQLKRDLRLSDTIGRTGGDEFVVVALGPSVICVDPALEMRHAADLLQERLTKATIGTYDLGNDLSHFRYAGASVGVTVVIPKQMSVEEAIMLADHEMYKTKQRRRLETTEKPRITFPLGL
ncbi:GGDEF domain-containing protein [Pseudomonas sp. W03]|uniref:GGDEF domain-containing protein n=1 Tax=Pseudomonas sp. W03 TaxID=3090666 RepID=UPI003A4DB711